MAINFCKKHVVHNVCSEVKWLFWNSSNCNMKLTIQPPEFVTDNGLLKLIREVCICFADKYTPLHEIDISFWLQHYHVAFHEKWNWVKPLFACVLTGVGGFFQVTEICYTHKSFFVICTKLVFILFLEIKEHQMTMDLIFPHLFFTF